MRRGEIKNLGTLFDKGKRAQLQYLRREKRRDPRRLREFQPFLDHLLENTTGRALLRNVRKKEKEKQEPSFARRGKRRRNRSLGKKTVKKGGEGPAPQV